MFDFSYAPRIENFAAYGEMNWISLGVVVFCGLAAFGLAAHAYDPKAGALKTLKRN